MAKPSYHARTHKPGGSDPIPGQIAFDVDNEGGYLRITTNATDTYPAALFIESTTGDTWWFPAGQSADTGGELNIVGDGISGFLMSSGGGVTVNSGSGADLQINVHGGDTVMINLLGASAKLQVVDSLNAPIFEVREDGSIHGPTGGSITWDL